VKDDQPEDDVAKKGQKRGNAKRSRPAGKRDLVRRPKASSYAKRTSRGRFKEMDDVEVTTSSGFCHDGCPFARYPNHSY
jgi:hypothetical protein